MTTEPAALSDLFTLRSHRNRSHHTLRPRTLAADVSVLLVEDGDDLVDVVRVGYGAVTVGRALSSTVSIDDPHVSRQHCTLQRDGDALVVHDGGSTNGTWRNGRRVESATLHLGERLTIGRTTLTFAFDSARPSRPAATRCNGLPDRRALQRHLHAWARVVARDAELLLLRSTAAGGTTADAIAHGAAIESLLPIHAFAAGLPDGSTAVAVLTLSHDSLDALVAEIRALPSTGTLDIASAASGDCALGDLLAASEPARVREEMHIEACRKHAAAVVGGA
jgi:hypothetical protein